MDAVKAFFEKVGLALEKAVSVLIDRRAWAVGLLVALMAIPGFFNIDQTLIDAVVDAFAESFDATVNWLTATVALVYAYGKLAAATVAVISLLRSWTERPPSGLEFKKLVGPFG